MLRRSLAVLSLALVVLGGACAKPQPTRVFGAQVTRPQPTTATVHGVVHDASGAPHPGATVGLEGLGLHLRATADGAGAYSFANLPAGTFVITVDADDTNSPTTDGVRIGPSTRSSRKEVTLHLGDNIVDAESGF